MTLSHVHCHPNYRVDVYFLILLPQECLRFVDKCSLNTAQKDAVRNVLDPAYQSVSTAWMSCAI